MATLNLLAIIFPKPGKTDRVVELLQKVSEYVKANEPGTLKYDILRARKDRASGKEEIVMAETYSDKNALKIHASSNTFKAFQKQMETEGLNEGPSKILIVRSVGGFTSKI